MTKRTLTATTIAAALVLAPATAAQADPHHRATAELQRENADHNEVQRMPLWMKVPDATPETPYGFADIILGVTFIVGAIVLY